MKVRNGNLVLNRVIAKLVGCTVDHTSADTTSGEPHGEPAGMMVPAFATLGGRGASKLPSPDHQSAFKQAPVFQIRQQPGYGPVGFGAMKVVIFLQVVMGIPGLWAFIPTTIKLDKAHPALNKATGKQTVSPEMMGGFIVQSIKVLDFRGFAGKIDCLGGVSLHAKCKFIGCNTGCKGGI